MKRTIAAISLVLAFAFASFGAATMMAQHPSATLTQKQLVSLLASAHTKADHLRLAQYYHAKSQDYLAQSKEHEASAEAYRKNPFTNNAKFKTGTVDHCDYFVQSFKDDAAKMDDLAKMHEAMASDEK